MNRQAQNVKENNLFINDFDTIQSSTIKYNGGNGEIDLYYEIDENNDPTQEVNVNEITTSLFPDLEILNTKINETSYDEIPVISTSAGKTYLYIRRLNPETEYRLDILRQKLLGTSDELNTSIFSKVAIKAYLYSADKNTELKHAKIQINGQIYNLPVFQWMPACYEVVLTNNLLKESIINTMGSKLEFNELLVLNEDVKKVATPYIELKNIIEEDMTLVISASPYNRNSEQIIEEFMISGTAKGNKKDIGAIPAI